MYIYDDLNTCAKLLLNVRLSFWMRLSSYMLPYDVNFDFSEACNWNVFGEFHGGFLHLKSSWAFGNIMLLILIFQVEEALCLK